MVGRVQVDLDALEAWLGGVSLAGWLLLGTGPVTGDLGRVVQQNEIWWKRGPLRK